MFNRAARRSGPLNSKAAMASEPQLAGAASRVLNIVELLEGILVHFRPQEILMVQRVSKAWQATITGSLPLQRALCYVPVGEPVNLERHIDRKLTPRLNHNTNEDDKSRCLPYILNEWTTFYPAERLLTEATAKQQCCLNPLLGDLFRERSSGGKLVTDRFLWELESATTPPWEQMYLTQPPLTRLWLHKSYYESRLTHSRKSSMEPPYMLGFDDVMVRADNGITISDLVRKLQEDDRISRDRDVVFMLG